MGSLSRLNKAQLTLASKSIHSAFNTTVAESITHITRFFPKNAKKLHFWRFLVITHYFSHFLCHFVQKWKISDYFIGFFFWNLFQAHQLFSIKLSLFSWYSRYLTENLYLCTFDPSSEGLIDMLVEVWCLLKTLNQPKVDIGLVQICEFFPVSMIDQVEIL